MQTTHDRATVTAHTGVTSAINTAIGHSSVAQTIEQAIHDTTTSAPMQSPVGSMLPSSIADVLAAAHQALDQVGAPGNPGAGQAPGLGLDLHAPSATDFLSQALGDLGVSVSSSASGAATQGPPGSGMPGPEDAAFWVGDEVTTAGTSPAPVRTNSDGEVVGVGNGKASSDFSGFAGIGNLIGTGGLSGPTRDAMQQALKEIDSDSNPNNNQNNNNTSTPTGTTNNAGGTNAGNNPSGGTPDTTNGSGNNPSGGTPDTTNGSGNNPSNGPPDTNNGNTGNTAGSGSDNNSGPGFSAWNDVFGSAKGYQDSNGDQHFAVDTGITYEPGHGWGRVISDTDVTTGTTTVTHTDNSTTKTDKDGNPIPTEGSAGIPVDPGVSDEGVRDPAKLAAAAQSHQFLHGNDNTNVAGSDIPGTVSADEVHSVNLNAPRPGVGDPGNSEGGQEGGQVKGAVTSSPNYNGNAGAVDFGPEHDEMPQTDGPSPRSTPAVTPIGHQTGGQSTTGHQGDGEQTVAVPPRSELAESTAQRLAHDLQNAVDSSHSDGHKTAQEVQSAHTGNDIASVLGSSFGSHDHGAFADLIQAAQNPLQAGLVTAPQSAGPVIHPDLHLALNGALAAHDLGTSDLHTATAPLAVHDVHIDQHAVVAPALDHHVEVTHH